MKVSVVKSPGTTKFTVKLVQDHQSFRLEYVGTKEECEWYSSMFIIALRKHDEEKKGER